MFMIYDTSLGMNVGITEEQTDVTLMSESYELREATEEALAEFEAYKLSIAVPEIVEEIIPDIIDEELTFE